MYLLCHIETTMHCCFDTIRWSIQCWTGWLEYTISRSEKRFEVLLASLAQDNDTVDVESDASHNFSELLEVMTSSSDEAFSSDTTSSEQTSMVTEDEEDIDAESNEHVFEAKRYDVDSVALTINTHQL